MKRYIVFLLFLIVSCSQEAMLDIYDYKGEMKDIFNDDDAKLDVTFSGTSSIALNLDIETWDDDRVISFTGGSYFIKSDYYFCADLDENVSFNVVLWKNIIDSSGIEEMDDINLDDYESINLKLELEGYLNSYEGKGNGEYKMKCKATLVTGEERKGEIKGDWELTRK